MLKIKFILLSLMAVVVGSVSLSGCGLLSSGSKAQAQNFYELSENAEKIYVTVINQNWTDARDTYLLLDETWQKTKETLPAEDAQKGEENLVTLSKAIEAGDRLGSCRGLNKFMGTVAEIGEKEKIMPLSIMIEVSTALRETVFYAVEEDWSKAAAKSKALINVWNHSKPAMEQVGILSEVTETHSFINRLQDAIDAEDKDAALEIFSEINETLAKIHKFHCG
jgi:hypothetical protein